MFRLLPIVALMLMSLGGASRADIIIFEFQKQNLPQFGIVGAAAIGRVDTVANTFTLQGFSSQDTGVYEIPDIPLVFGAYNGSLNTPWDIDDNANDGDIIQAINSGAFAFVSNQVNSAINWSTFTADSDGRIAWGAYVSGTTFIDQNYSSFQGWHDVNDFTNFISWDSIISYGAPPPVAVPEPSSLLLLGLAAIMLIMYRRKRSCAISV